MIDKMPLPQPIKIKKRKTFLSARYNGRKYVVNAIVLNILKSSENVDKVRVGFTTTKRLGNAVTRNYVRRKLREAARFVLPVKAIEGYDYVIIARYSSITRTVEDLKKDINTALNYFKAANPKRKCDE